MSTFSDSWKSAWSMAKDGSFIDTGLGPAPTTGNDMYDRLYQANPYRNLTYKKSLWQKFISMLGFRTDADRWLEDAQVNSNEYDAQVASIMQQNDYNEPTAIAQRERAAGMNPDLLGIGDVAESASPTEDVNGMSQNLGDEFISFGESVMGIVTRSLALYKDFKGIAELNNIIDSGNIENAKSMIDIVDGIIEGELTPDIMESESSFRSFVNSHYQDGIDSVLDKAVDDYGFSRRQANQFKRLYQQRFSSLKISSNAYSLMKERLTNRNAVKEQQSSPFAFDNSGINESAIDGVVYELSGLYREGLKIKAQNDKYAEQIRTTGLDIENEEAQYLADNMAGTRKAQSELADWDENWYAKQMNISIEKAKKRIVDGLERRAKNGDGFAKVLLLNWTLNNMVSLGANFSASVGANFGLSDIYSKIDKVAQ